jgi:cell division protease FtsH
MENAERILRENTGMLHRLAGRLIEKESLGAEEIGEITGIHQEILKMTAE